VRAPSQHWHLGLDAHSLAQSVGGGSHGARCLLGNISGTATCVLAGAVHCTRRVCTARGERLSSRPTIFCGDSQRTHALQIEEVTTSKTGKHGHAKANYYGYDIFTNKRYEDMAPTSHNVLQPVVLRLEYTLTDINEDDLAEDGAICTLMEADGSTREDLRVPQEPEYKAMRDALEDGSKDILVTVTSAMGAFRVDPQFTLKDPNTGK